MVVVCLAAGFLFTGGQPGELLNYYELRRFVQSDGKRDFVTGFMFTS
jgi:hypothetical protein